MITVTLTNDQLKTITRTVQGDIDFYFDEIRKAKTDAEYSGMMDSFENLAGALAILKQAARNETA